MIGIFLIIGGIVFSILATKEQLPFIQADTLNKNIREKYITESEPEDKNSEDDINSPESEKWQDPMKRKIDFEGLRKINADIRAWIYVPGTEIDFPVCVGRDNNYYLNHNFEQKYSKTGTVFLHKGTKLMEDAHIIFYGHTPGMFGSLANFEDEAYKEHHPYLYIYTEEDTKKCIFVDSGYVSAGDQNYKRAFALGSEEYDNWLQSLDIYSDKENQIFTLSTCAKGNEDGRYLVRFTHK